MQVLEEPHYVGSPSKFDTRTISLSKKSEKRGIKTREKIIAPEHTENIVKYGIRLGKSFLI
jgi:hypothetical protein